MKKSGVLIAALFALAGAAVVAGCGGGASSGSGTIPHPVPTQATNAIVALKLGVPAAGTASRRPKYISPSTNGIAVYAYPSSTSAPASPSTIADVSTGAGSICTANADGSRTCNVNVTAPVGTDDFLIQTYDQTPSGGVPQGKILGTSTIANQTIAPGTTNTTNVVVDAVAAKIQLSPQLIPTSQDGQAHSMTVIANAIDADGNYIVSTDPLSNPIGVSVQTGDPNNTISIATPAPGGDPTHFTINYNGGAIPTYATLWAAAAGATLSANSYVIPLQTSATSMSLSVGQTATLNVVQQLTAGPYRVVSSNYSTCGVNTTNTVPASGVSQPVAFSISGVGPGTCSLTVSSAMGSVVTIPVTVTQTNSGITVPGFSKIKHVVFVIQENRSFDNLFTGFCNSNGWCNDAPLTAQAHDGSTVARQPISLALKEDPDHLHPQFVAEYNGGLMNGFDLETYNMTLPSAPSPPPDLAYDYVQQSDVQPYWNMASSYALAARMFQSNTGASFVAHQYLIAGQSGNTIDVPDGVPWGCDAPAGTNIGIFNGAGQEVSGPFPCFNYLTMADEMDAAGVSWKYYAPQAGTDIAYIWSAYDAINQIRNGPDWTTDVSSPETNILTDAQNCNLPQMTWVTPSSATSDHPTSGTTDGPAWVTSIVNTIMNGSCGYYSNTAIFVLWDDWGGWYDHVAPPQIDMEGLGMRVPMFVVSGYAKHGYVSMTQHEFGSMLHFVEKTFNLPSLGQRDAISDDMSDMFDFSQTPGTYTPFVMRHSMAEVRRASAASQGQPPDNDDFVPGKHPSIVP